MPYAGQTITNPVTRERLTFVRTGDETDGELLEIDLSTDPGEAVIGAHLHPKLEETFRIVAGEGVFIIGGVEQRLGVGSTVTIATGAFHDWYNPSKTDVLAMRIEFRPAGRIAESLETVFGLARDGKVDSDGRPNPLQGSVVCAAYWDDFQPAVMPPNVRKTVFFTMAKLGRLLGYRARYPRYTDTPTTNPTKTVKTDDTHPSPSADTEQGTQNKERKPCHRPYTAFRSTPRRRPSGTC